MSLDLGMSLGRTLCLALGMSLGRPFMSIDLGMSQGRPFMSRFRYLRVFHYA